MPEARLANCATRDKPCPYPYQHTQSHALTLSLILILSMSFILYPDPYNYLRAFTLIITLKFALLEDVLYFLVLHWPPPPPFLTHRQ
jgi:hypothetical protein